MSKVAIVGHGNVGFHLANVFSTSHQITVYTHKPVGSESDLKSLVTSSYDFILLTVPDKAINEVSNTLEASQAIILHTSGSRPLSDLSKHKRTGVFYPLQTFSKEKTIDFEQVQIFIEGTKEIEDDIKQLAESVSNKVRVASSSERAKMHLAAVFACNFSNHMFSIAEEHLKEIDMKFQDLLPLVRETLNKAVMLGPSNSQTGPAVRKDQVTIDKHMNMLNEDERVLYALITKSIQKDH